MNNEKLQTTSNRLPFKRSLMGDYVLSFIIALLMAATSIFGLLASNTFYSVEEMRNSFVTAATFSVLKTDLALCPVFHKYDEKQQGKNNNDQKMQCSFS